ncbi:MAG: IS66 family transposase zinc-finger binding domain-containing protein [Sandaracinaceae bacterium]|nr:IS66 family transposase zinc-finger binding domain-containing protein [Sandaracinaceae bacterium]
MDLRHESDIEQLRRIALAQEGQIRILLKVLQDKCAELRRLTGHEEELQQTIALITDLQRKPVAAETASTTARKRPKNTQTGHGPSEQPALPHVDVEVDLDQADRVCTSCGGQLDEWVGQFEESELVDVVEVQYRVVKVKRKKYRCACGGCVATADGGPERVIPGGRYSLTFGAKVATDKHLDHQPLERQVRILKRHGLTVTSQTLGPAVCAQHRARAHVPGAPRCDPRAPRGRRRPDLLAPSAQGQRVDDAVADVVRDRAWRGLPLHPRGQVRRVVRGAARDLRGQHHLRRRVDAHGRHQEQRQGLHRVLLGARVAQAPRRRRRPPRGAHRPHVGDHEESQKSDRPRHVLCARAGLSYFLAVALRGPPRFVASADSLSR